MRKTEPADPSALDGSLLLPKTKPFPLGTDLLTGSRAGAITGPPGATTVKPHYDQSWALW